MADWKEALKSADVDVDGAIERFSNKEERYLKYLRLFYEDTNFNDLIDDLGGGNIHSAFEHCHTLKGLAGNLGFSRIFPKVYDACEILRSGSDEGVIKLLDEVTDNYNEIITIIGELIVN